MPGLGLTELFFIGTIASFIIFFIVLLLLARAVGTNARLDRLERRVEAIAQHVGLPGSVRAGGSPSGTQTYSNYGAFDSSQPGGSFDEDIQRLIRAGRKIEAIKLYRERNPVGLKEAKDAVEAIASRM
jgi:ribosomal protein L7/L12